MNRDLIAFVRVRARQRCEYCLLPQFAFPLPFQIDHIIAEKHRGLSIESNLALACPHCNSYKGSNIAGFYEETKEVVRLFHPRTDLWSDHFVYEDLILTARTRIGQATIDVLEINEPDRLMVRKALVKEGVKFSPLA